MRKQATIKNPFELIGSEPFGGNIVRARFSPAEPDTGIVFETFDGEIEAKLKYASEYKCSVLLRNGNAGVLHPEHLLATLLAYGVDNLRIDLERDPSFSFRILEILGMTTDLAVVPNFDGKTYGLCEKLDDNIEEQDRPKKLLTLDRKVGVLEEDKLTFEPWRGRGLYIEATTDYPILGEQTLGINVDAETYKREIARSRPYSKHIVNVPLRILSMGAAIANPSFGIGHGFDPEENVMFPVKSEEELHKAREIYPIGDEPARHTIMDRLGAITLLHGSLDGVKVSVKYSGHANDVEMLRRVTPYLNGR
ncbi:UDP-3-O-acyl-N-acetylglucosamine deacetylase [Nanoarchaeota archaeon]